MRIYATSYIGGEGLTRIVEYHIECDCGFRFAIPPAKILEATCPSCGKYSANVQSLEQMARPLPARRIKP